MKQYTLERKHPRTGFNEQIVYTGNLKNKPKGWKMAGELK